jgi:methionyl-tRNA synthetase
MAAGLPLPKSVVAHGWLLFEESKMSKSRGNIVRTETILDAFGTEVYAKQFTESTKAEQDLFAADVLRYFLLREIPFGQDGSFSFDALIQRYNSDLANGYGNLVSRTLKMIADYFGECPNYDFPQESGSWNWHQWLEHFHKISPIKIFWSESSDAKGETNGPQVMDIFNSASSLHSFLEIEGVIVHAGSIARIQALISLTDRYLSINAPWKLAKSTDTESRKQLAEVLYAAAESIRIITALLYPILPYSTASVWSQLGLGSIERASENGELRTLTWGGLRPGTKLGARGTLFPSIKKEDIPRFIQLMTDMESSTHLPTPATGPESVQSVVASPPAPTDNLQPATDNSITIDDFVKIDLRVAQIVVAERIPKADKLLRLEVDLGPNFTPSRRQILSGIAEWYTPEELIGRRIAVIANLAPRKMRGLESHGMLLAASADDHASKPILATFSDEIPLGSRIR